MLTRSVSWHLSVSGSSMTVAGLVGDCYCFAELRCAESGSLDVGVSTRTMADVAGALPADASSVTIEQTRAGLILRAGDSRFMLPVYPTPPLGVPQVDQSWDSNHVLVAADRLRRSIRLAAVATSVGSITGPAIQLAGDGGDVVSISATDMYELSLVRLDGRSLDGRAWRATTAPELLDFALRFLGASTSEVAITSSGSSVRFGAGRDWVAMPTKLASRIPEVDRSPSAAVSIDRIPRLALLDALDRVSALMVSEKGVTITVDAGSLVVSATQEPLGSVLTEIAVRSDASIEPLKLRRAPLREWLRSLRAEQIGLRYRPQSQHPIWHSDPDDLEATLIMSGLRQDLAPQ